MSVSVSVCLWVWVCVSFRLCLCIYSWDMEWTRGASFRQLAATNDMQDVPDTQQQQHTRTEYTHAHSTSSHTSISIPAAPNHVSQNPVPVCTSWLSHIKPHPFGRRVDWSLANKEKAVPTFTPYYTLPVTNPMLALPFRHSTRACASIYMLGMKIAKQSTPLIFCCPMSHPGRSLF